MRAYSMDLRERALLDSDAGMKAADVATKYRVSGSWVRLLKQRRRETGEIAPRPQRHGRCRMLAPHLHTLAALIAEQPDRTLAELKDALGTPASVPTVWRAAFLRAPRRNAASGPAAHGATCASSKSTSATRWSSAARSSLVSAAARSRCACSTRNVVERPTSRRASSASSRRAASSRATAAACTCCSALRTPALAGSRDVGGRLELQRLDSAVNLPLLHPGAGRVGIGPARAERHADVQSHAPGRKVQASDRRERIQVTARHGADDGAAEAGAVAEHGGATDAGGGVAGDEIHRPQPLALCQLQREIRALPIALCFLDIGTIRQGRPDGRADVDCLRAGRGAVHRYHVGFPDRVPRIGDDQLLQRDHRGTPAALRQHAGLHPGCHLRFRLQHINLCQRADLRPQAILLELPLRERLRPAGVLEGIARIDQFPIRPPNGGERRGLLTVEKTLLLAFRPLVKSTDTRLPHGNS